MMGRMGTVAKRAPWVVLVALCAHVLGCGIPLEASAQFVPNDALSQCGTLVMCGNERICDLSTASSPATWCRSTPRPTALRADCNGGYTAITFTPADTRGATYYYLDGTLVAAMDSELEGGDGVACGPDGMTFQAPSCSAGIDLCAQAADGGTDEAGE